MNLGHAQNQTLVEIHLQSNIGTTQNKENTHALMIQPTLYLSWELLKPEPFAGTSQQYI